MSTTRTYTRDEQTRTEAETERTAAREPTTCPECGGRLEQDSEHGETVCTQCGLVVEDAQIDRGPEWRSFEDGDGESRSRVGAPTTKLMHDKGLSSQIGWQDRDAYGTSLSASQRKRAQRMRTWDERFRTRDSKERNLKQALGEIERMGSALGLPKPVRETASVIYRRALEADLLPGRTIEGIATAATYAAARQMGSPRSLDEVAAVSRVDEMRFKRAYRYIVRELDLAVAPADPQSYINRFASELDLEPATERLARDLLETAEGTQAVTGKNPVGLAAAAIYAAAQLDGTEYTQEEVGEVADVSEVTIRNRYQELLAVREDAADDHAAGAEAGPAAEA